MNAHANTRTALDRILEARRAEVDHRKKVLPETALKYDVRCALYNDAGIGKDAAGTSRLPALDARGIAAATVERIVRGWRGARPARLVEVVAR